MKTFIQRFFRLGAALLTAATLATSCQFIDTLLASLDGETPSPAAVQFLDDAMHYGDHVYSVRGAIESPTPGVHLVTPTAWVTFTNVPADYQEFEAVYTQYLGKSPHGAAGMMPMALEMYARDAEEGTRCLELLCGDNASSVIRILQTKFTPSAYSPDNDPYIQRYLPAATLKGAKAENGYTPDKPYTVQMCTSANLPQEPWLFLYILAEGWDTNQRQVTVKQVDGLYQVSNCPSLYTQCKNIRGSWPGLD